MPCRCIKPLIHTRPSGQKVCLNLDCGSTIEPKAEKQVRP